MDLSQSINSENQPLVQLRHVSKSYHRGEEVVHVLEDLNLEINQGELVALMGPSGSGKSTLLNLIGGLDRPDRGAVIVGGRRIDRLSDRQLADWRARHVGFVFQLYNLLPALTAERNVELPLLLTSMPKAERRRRVRLVLSLVGLAHRARHYPSQLSGGEQQRVAIARALITDPDLLLCDEPTGDLDRRSADEILDLLVRLNERHGKTILMVTHDPHVAGRAARCIFLYKGQVVDQIPT